MHRQYLRAVLRHKWFVLVAGLGRVPFWRLLVHDWSKFGPAEWGPYARSFYGSQPRTQQVKNDFNRAWLHHQKFNLHHWQYWVMQEDDGKVYCLPMPGVYREEMLADWKGANRAYGTMTLAAWYERTKAGRRLHPETQAWVEREIGLGGLRAVA